MEGKNSRWQFRFKSHSDALASIEEIIPRYKDLNELEKDGLVQRFEFTVELVWKVMQDYLRETGYQGLSGPRPVIIQMGADGLIDPFMWNEILSTRNELSHIYDEDRSREHLDHIIFDYIPTLQQFQNKMLNLV